ncbi:hypothetical protein GQX74_011634 [Glossina fuscipes]|nr:hypothetical protein GQX74_011634 [Glossina fuscipes]
MSKLTTSAVLMILLMLLCTAPEKVAPKLKRQARNLLNQELQGVKVIKAVKNEYHNLFKELPHLPKETSETNEGMLQKAKLLADLVRKEQGSITGANEKAIVD